MKSEKRSSPFSWEGRATEDMKQFSTNQEFAHGKVVRHTNYNLIAFHYSISRFAILLSAYLSTRKANVTTLPG